MSKIISIKPVTHLGTQNREPAFKPQTVSVEFNGTDEYMMNLAEQLINVGNVYTWSMWIKPQAGAFTAQSRIFSFLPPTGALNAYVFDVMGAVENDPVYLIMWNTAGALLKRYVFDNLLTEDVWSFLTVTWDGGANEFLLYLNGSLIAPVKETDNLGSRVDGADHIIIVGSNLVGSTSMDCRIHSTALWSTALGLNEHIALYNAGDGTTVDWSKDSGNYVSSTTLQHWWRLGHDSSDMGKDSGIQQGQGNINIGDDAVGIDTSNIVADYPGL